MGRKQKFKHWIILLCSIKLFNVYSYYILCKMLGENLSVTEINQIEASQPINCFQCQSKGGIQGSAPGNGCMSYFAPYSPVMIV